MTTRTTSVLLTRPASCHFPYITFLQLLNVHVTMCTSPCACHHVHVTMCTSPCARHHVHVTMCTSPCARHHVHVTMCKSPCARHHVHVTMCMCVLVLLLCNRLILRVQMTECVLCRYYSGIILREALRTYYMDLCHTKKYHLVE